MKKNLLVLFSVFIAVISLSNLTAMAQSTTASISMDGKQLNSQAVIDADSVYLPVRSLCEALGYKVDWSIKDGKSTVTLQKDDDKVVLNLTDNKMDDNGHSYNYAQMASFENRSYMEASLFDSIFPTKTQYSSANCRVTISQLNENAIKITAKTLTSQAEYLDLTIQYPQVSGLSNTTAQTTINTALYQSALDAKSLGQKNAEEMKQWITDGYAGAVTKCTTYFDYTVRYNQNGLLSIVMQDYQYTGGAHGSTLQSSYTFDLSSGKALSLADLMASGSNYTSFFNSGIRKEIDKRVASGELYEFDDAKFTSIGTIPAYYLSNNGIVFYFQQYEYFPYAAGIQEFSFSYSDLQNLLKTEYKCL